MNPFAVHRICQEIRNERNELNAEEKWARSIDHRETRAVMLDKVFFWRKVLDFAEKLVTDGQQSAVK